MVYSWRCLSSPLRMSAIGNVFSARSIIDDLKRGCTLYEVIGGYSNEKSIELEVLLTKDEFSKLLAYLKDNEISAFTTAGNVSEVYGLWTKHSKKKALKHEAESR